jgi:hypothetical protein
MMFAAWLHGNNVGGLGTFLAAGAVLAFPYAWPKIKTFIESRKG